MLVVKMSKKTIPEDGMFSFAFKQDEPKHYKVDSSRKQPGNARVTSAEELGTTSKNKDYLAGVEGLYAGFALLPWQSLVSR